MGLVGFLAGLVCARWLGWRVEPVLLFLFVPAFFFVRKRAFIGLLGIVLFGCFLGVWRGHAQLQQINQYADFTGKEVVVAGNVTDDPVYDDRGRLDFRISGVQINGQPLPGQVRVRTFVNDLRRGDNVQVIGTLLEGFGNYQAAMYFGGVTILDRSDSPVENLRRRFFAAVYSVLPEPEGSLGLGFLAGLRSALPEEFDDQLRVAGLTHIVVASGYNLTVLARLSRRLLTRRSKYQAMAGSLMLILGMIAVTGASPSMLRAGVVTILSLWAWYYGRRFHPVLIILLGAALTAGFNPLYVWFDLGWWLSFLAFAGVLVLAPLITARFWKDKQPPVLAQVAIETTAAQMMALPLIMAVFGEVSLVSLFANIAVVPFIPLAMAAALGAGIASLLVPAIAGWFALPARLILEYIVSASRFFASLSWAKQDVAISQIEMYAVYATILFAGIVLYNRLGYRLREAASVVE